MWLCFSLILSPTSGYEYLPPHVSFDPAENFHNSSEYHLSPQLVQTKVSVYKYDYNPENELDFSAGHRKNPAHILLKPLLSDNLDLPLIKLPTSKNRPMEIVFEGNALEFDFPSEEEKQAALKDGRYKPNNILPIDVDVYSPSDGSRTQVFMTIPRFDRGPPYSLARVRNEPGQSGIKLEAYPDYSWHSSYGANCKGLASVYRVMIDPCNRMWILDSGEIGRNHTCSPQIVVFDIPSHREVHRYELPRKVYVKDYSRLVTIVLDVADPPPHGRCEKTFAYLADATSFALVVYDHQKRDSWRIENRFTYPNPHFSKHTVAGESFELLDGVFGMSVTPHGLNMQRMLYFHSLSNDLLAAVPLDVLNNGSYFRIGDISARLKDFHAVGQRGVQCTVSAMTPHGYLLCGFLNPIGIVGWDIRKPYTAENRITLAENHKTLQFIGGLKIAPNAEGKLEVWMLSNRAQKFFSGTNNLKEINYRVQKCGLNELLLGLPC
ncbi:major royal jelly protein 1 [Musca domestica]|uniref:Major royal jelly protein 1 n=2 Tax=Musca domestica TaxID=7370 RepID=A0A9J7D4B7_MUSDO|nr:major royal jelly protein 1 [Musca domestica]